MAEPDLATTYNYISVKHYFYISMLTLSIYFLFISCLLIYIFS